MVQSDAAVAKCKLVGCNNTGLFLTAVGLLRTCCKLCCISGFCISVIQPLYLSCTVITATPSNLWMLSNSLCRRHSCGISLLAPAGSSRNETDSCQVCHTIGQSPQEDTRSTKHHETTPHHSLVLMTNHSSCFVGLETCCGAIACLSKTQPTVTNIYLSQEA